MAHKQRNKKIKEKTMQRKFGSRKGATFIEYALLAGLVAIIVAAAAMIFGDDLRSLFTEESKQTESVTKGVQGVDLKSTFESKEKKPEGN